MSEGIAKAARAGLKACATIAAAACACTLSLRAQPRHLVIAVGTALDGRGGVIRDTRLVIEDGKIARIDPSASPVDYDLRTLTVTPGWIASLGLASHIGSLAPGMDADIVATEGNLLDDITAVRRVRFVMKGGQVYRSGS